MLAMENGSNVWDTSPAARAQRLRVAMRWLYANIKDMADKTGWGRQHVGMMLSGDRPVPHGMLDSLKAAGVSADFILYGDLRGVEPDLVEPLAALLETADHDDQMEAAARPGRKKRHPKKPDPAADV